MRILLDTSFLMIPGNYNVDVLRQIKENYPEAELYTLSGVIKELQGLSEGTKPGLKGKHKKAAKLGLTILKKRKDIQIIAAEGKVDDLILELREYVPATTDNALIKKLDKQRRDYIEFLQNKYIHMR